MATDITVTITPPATKTVVIGNGITAHAVTHAPGGSDSLENYYATTGNLAYVSGQIGAPVGVVLTTGDQGISGAKNFFTRPTVNGTGVLLSGEASAQSTGYLTGYVNKTETGNFLSSSQTGQLTGEFYPRNQNPSGYITGIDLSSYATIVLLTGTSGHLQGQIDYLTGVTGSFITGDVVRPSDTGFLASTGFVVNVSGGLQTQLNTLQSGTGSYVLKTETGQYTGSFYPLNQNPSGYITGLDLSNYATIPYVTGISGNLQLQLTELRNETGSYALKSQTGAFLTTGAGNTLYVSKSETGSYTGEFYPRNSNPSGYITGVDLSTYSTTAQLTGVSGHLQTQITALNSNTGSYVTGNVVRPSETGAFLTTGAGDARYVSASGNQTITGVKDFASRPTVNGSIVLITGDSVNAVVANVVYTTGNQDISGAKNFFTRPTVNGTGVLLSGESARPVFLAEVYVHKNGTNQSISYTASVPVLVTWGTEVQDTGGDFASDTLTVESGEVWEMKGNVRVQNNNGGHTQWVSLYRNGSLYQVLSEQGPWGGAVRPVSLNFNTWIEESGAYTIQSFFSSNGTLGISGAVTDTYLKAKRLI